jgi:predicted DNA-binding transcriptional regulator YafY
MAAGDRQAEDFVFSQTTVDDIVAAAGASRRTFFRYFESKRDLIAQPVASYAAQDRVAKAFARRSQDEVSAHLLAGLTLNALSVAYRVWFRDGKQDIEGATRKGLHNISALARS